MHMPTKIEKKITMAVDLIVCLRVGQVTCFNSSTTSLKNPRGDKTKRPIAAKIGMESILSQSSD